MTQPATPPFDEQNIAALIAVCRSLKAKLIPHGASPEGWNSAIATLERFEGIRSALASATTAPPLSAEQQRVVDDFARAIAARRIPAENWGELHDAWRMRAEKAEAALASAREDWASAQVSLDALTNAMQFIWDALDNDDEAEAFAMADRWRARSDSKEGV